MANISSNTYIKPYYLITLGNQHQLNVSVQRKIHVHVHAYRYMYMYM